MFKVKVADPSPVDDFIADCGDLVGDMLCVQSAGAPPGVAGGLPAPGGCPVCTAVGRAHRPVPGAAGLALLPHGQKAAPGRQLLRPTCRRLTAAFKCTAGTLLSPSFAELVRPHPTPGAAIRHMGARRESGRILPGNFLHTFWFITKSMGPSTA